MKQQKADKSSFAGTAAEQRADADNTHVSQPIAKPNVVRSPLPCADFVFTAENLLDNLYKMGPWSMYALASEALSYYYHDLYNDETGECPEVIEEVELTRKLGCQYWDELVIKFHKEIGYKPLGGIFSSDYVNVY